MTWLIYRDKCPECPTEPKGEVIRQIFSRYDFCSKNCGMERNKPSLTLLPVRINRINRIKPKTIV